MVSINSYQWQINDLVTKALLDQNIRDNMTALLNRPFFWFYRTTTDEGFISSTWKRCQLDGVHADSENGRESINGFWSYRVQTTGLWYIIGAIPWKQDTTPSGLRYCQVAKDSTSAGTNSLAAFSGGFVDQGWGYTTQTHFMTKITAGSYLNLDGYQSSGSSLTYLKGFYGGPMLAGICLRSG